MTILRGRGRRFWQKSRSAGEACVATLGQCKGGPVDAGRRKGEPALCRGGPAAAHPSAPRRRGPERGPPAPARPARVAQIGVKRDLGRLG